jgi:hypothetical protein
MPVPGEGAFPQPSRQSVTAKGGEAKRKQAMRKLYAFPQLLLAALVAALILTAPVPAAAFDAKPESQPGTRVVDHLMATNFTKQCDVNTYPLQKNLSFLFDNKYIGLKFQSWEVTALGGNRFRVTLHYIDGEAGPATARWEVNLDSQKSRLGDENAEVLSCMTGYL